MVHGRAVDRNPLTSDRCPVILSDAFVFLHMPKTGGTFVTEMLRRVSAEYPDLGIEVRDDLKHEGVKRIPKDYREKPVVTCVRHPMAHYVSRYHFAEWQTRMLSEDRSELIRARYPDFPDLSFPDFLRIRNDWDVALPRKAKNDALRRVLIEKKIGFGTRRFVGMLSRRPQQLLQGFDEMSDAELDACFADIGFLATETLNRDLHAFLTQVLRLDPGRVGFVAEHKPVQPKKARLRRALSPFGGAAGGRKTDWRDYFSPDDAAWLAHRERLLFRLFRDRYTPQPDPAALRAG